jgi:putative transposase
MNTPESLKHTKWECKYHIVWIQVVGFIKGTSAISIARTYAGRRKNFTGQKFWARGYYVSTVSRDEETVRNYIKHQEEEDKRIDQLDLF